MDERDSNNLHCVQLALFAEYGQRLAPNGKVPQSTVPLTKKKCFFPLFLNICLS